MICAFFGHSDSPESIKPLLELAVKRIAEHYPNITFYVGHNGNFDRMALSVLKKLSANFPSVSYAVIHAYLPSCRDEFYDDSATIYPDDIEYVPKKYAISHRNDWIVKQADMVVCYITHSFGGAAKFVEKARKSGKTVYNIAEF